MLLRLWLLLTLAVFTFAGHAFDLPTGLTASDRTTVVRTLGLNSATKMLTSPYPLGGYSGFEIGYSMEFINIENLHGLGDGSVSDNTWSYPRITIGKGIYHDLDVFFHFVPPIGNNGITDYGGMVRYSFYQARFLPINFSVFGHLDQLNFHDDYTNRNLGLEFLAGLNLEDFEVYFGAGWIQAASVFSSRITAADDPNSNTSRARLDAFHAVVGASAHYEEFFAAAEVDRIQDAVYSFKLGLRF